ncbi:hypothetical protein YC2023_014477 [Brassica napus]
MALNIHYEYTPGILEKIESKSLEKIESKSLIGFVLTFTAVEYSKAPTVLHANRREFSRKLADVELCWFLVTQAFLFPILNGEKEEKVQLKTLRQDIQTVCMFFPAIVSFYQLLDEFCTSSIKCPL